MAEGTVDPFAQTRKVAELMQGFGRPWFVAGGWAIDLHLGRLTREHRDIEIAILRKDQGELRRQLAGWEFQKVVRESLEPWDSEEWLELPVHEVHVRNEGSNPSTLEILLNESQGSAWKFRRNQQVTRPLVKLGKHTEDGIPYLSPEIVLLYKAKDSRAYDERDFDAVADQLDRESGAWLKRAVRTCHPGHPWIARLSSAR